MATAEMILPIQGAVLDPTEPPSLAIATGGTTMQGWVMVFNKDAENQCFWQFKVPANYASAPALVIQYDLPDTNSGDVRWRTRVLAVAAGQDYDFEAEDDYTDHDVDAAGTADLLTTATLPLTANDSMAADEFVVIQLHRDGDDATNDDADSDAHVRSVTFTYTTG